MITVFFSRKSGPGKTTISCSMAAYLNNQWKKVCLVDADPQQSSRRWADRRAAEYVEEDKIDVYTMTGDIEDELLKLKGFYEHIIVDCAGKDSIEMRSALCVADLAVMPSVPSHLDREHFDYISNLIKKIKKENPKLKVKTVVSLVTAEDANQVKITKKKAKELKLGPVGATVKFKGGYKEVMEHGLGGTESDTAVVSNGMVSVIKEILK